MNLIETREKLAVLLHRQRGLGENLGVESAPIDEIERSLAEGELSVAVVGEVNRGKSTFLNALLGAKVFPSRVSVCTAGVTILENGNTPQATVIFRGGKTAEVELNADEPSRSLASVVSRQNEDVRDVEAVRVRYPNQFTRHGIVLVDTPGVNDPESWREDITYTYLANADAVVMLLDPLQPLSASEVEFLDTKILKRSIANLIFVVNKIDDVRVEDRQTALTRIERLLSEHVPSPVIYAVAAKPALAAKQAGSEEQLSTTGLPAFEEGLMEFLSEGRGSLLLRTKAQKALHHLDYLDSAVASRRAALDVEKETVRDELKQARKELQRLDEKRRDLERDLKRRRSLAKLRLTQSLRQRIDYLDSSLKPSLLGEPDVVVLKDRTLRFQRDSVETFRMELEETYQDIILEFGGTAASLIGEVNEVLGNLHRQAINAVQELRVERSSNTSHEQSRQGAIVGGAVGAAAGMSVAAAATTVTTVAVPTAAGVATGVASTAAFGTAGILGIGLLTGGVGILVGLGVAALLSDDKDEEERYIGAADVVSNQQAIGALDRFMSRLMASVGPISKQLIASAKKQALKPITQASRNQQHTMQQIENDLNRTENGQAALRQRLHDVAKKTAALRFEYQDLFGLEDVQSS